MAPDITCLAVFIPKFFVAWVSLVISEDSVIAVLRGCQIAIETKPTMFIR
jgi:hypothetical protein